MAVGVNIVSQFDSKGITKAIRDFRSLEGAGAKSTFALRTMDKAAQNIAKSLAKVGMGAAVLGGYAVKEFASFDDAMTQSTAIMGDLSDEMKDKMAAAARQMARETTFSATEAAKSFYFLASAGLDAQSSLKALPIVARFGQAGMFDMALATDLLTDAQSALGLVIRDDAVANMKNMTRVSDVLVRANTLANASVQQFSEALTNKAGPAMKSVGMDIEEGVAVLAALADQGIKAEEAGTQFGIALRDLQTKSIENRAAFEALGVQVFDSSGELNNMGEIVGQLETGLSGMSDEQKKVTLAQMGFSDKSVSTILALLGTSEAIKGYEEQLRLAGGTTQTVADKQLDSLMSQLKLARNAVNDLALMLGQKLEPYVRKATQFIQEFSRIVGEEGLSGGLRFLGEGFLNATTNGGAFTNVIIGLVAAFTALRLISIAATISQVAFNTALLANPIGIAVAGVIALGVAAVALYTKFEVVRKVVHSVINFLIGAIENWLNMWIRVINGIIDGINMMRKVANFFGGDMEMLGHIGEVEFGRIGKAADGARKKIGSVAEVAGAMASKEGGVGQMITKLKLAAQVTKDEDNATNSMGKTVETVKEKLQKYIDALKGTTSAQRGLRDAQKATLKANTDLIEANTKLTEAQEYFNQIISGYGKDSKQAKDKQKELAKAQRDVERSGYDVEGAVFAVKKAEQELADLRKDPQTTPMAIREAEIALAEAKLRVADATDAQAEASMALDQAQSALDETVNGAKEGSDLYTEALDRLNDAKKAQEESTDRVAEAIEREKDAVDRLREAEEKLAEVRKTTPSTVVTRAEEIIFGGGAGGGGTAGGVSFTPAVIANNPFTSTRRNEMLDLIPFARGGIVTSPTAALIGEAGAEAVVPLNQVGALGGTQNIYLTINAGMGVDPAVVGDEIVNVLQRYNRRNGALPLKVA